MSICEPPALHAFTTAWLSSMNSALNVRPSSIVHNRSAGSSSLLSASSAETISASSALWTLRSVVENCSFEAPSRLVPTETVRSH
eukprot:1322825-Pyramimonas_sp.AAC.1